MMDWWCLNFTSLFNFFSKIFPDISSQFFTHPVNITKRLGEEATFDCVTEESLPYASIYWEKDGKYFAEGVSFQIPSTKSSSSALLVKNVTFTSAGWYRCVATNPLLPNQPQRSRKAYLVVLRKCYNNMVSIESCVNAMWYWFLSVKSISVKSGFLVSAFILLHILTFDVMIL